MTTFKDVLCLLPIFIAYGVTGRLDYEDAVQLEEIQKERRDAECLLTTPSQDGEAQARVAGHCGDPSTRCPDKAFSADGAPCAPQLP